MITDGIYSRVDRVGSLVKSSGRKLSPVLNTELVVIVRINGKDLVIDLLETLKYHVSHS